MGLIDDKRNQLKAALTPEFFNTLVEASKIIGWDSTDWGVIDEFICELHEIAEIEPPREEERQPYEHDDED